jgi:hypothetical protein
MAAPGAMSVMLWNKTSRSPIAFRLSPCPAAVTPLTATAASETKGWGAAPIMSPDMPPDKRTPSTASVTLKSRLRMEPEPVSTLAQIRNQIARRIDIDAMQDAYRRLF